MPRPPIIINLGERYRHPSGWVRTITGFGWCPQERETVHYTETFYVGTPEEITSLPVSCALLTFRSWISKHSLQPLPSP